jgi:hypothetical protein
MPQTINYKTSYLQDKYEIFTGDVKIGKLYKNNWLGSTIESTVNSKDFKFISNGIINPIITIFDKKNNKSIGKARIHAFFKFRPTVILTMTNNKMYKWDAKGWISSHWQWIDMNSTQVVLNADDQLNVFKNFGSISSSLPNNDMELLIGLGIHLRNIVPRANRISVILGVIILSIFLPKLFS